ncbi:ubiquitin-conjugating enzyme/RWD-like protein [Mycena rebaudengoi]|nr:ubiquitin-conjugating enzyme/RWD-like protein [Mycena rebaudengoi]
MSHPGPATLKRIHREISDVKKEDLGDITLVPSDDLYVWRGTLPGPEGSIYEGGVFNIAVNLPPDYPYVALVQARDHSHNWSPALSLFKVMLSLSSLLTDPNPKDPLVPTIASQYQRNRKLHDSTARQWVDLYARPKPPPPPPRAPPPPPPKSKSKKKAAVTDSGPIVIDDSDDEGGKRAAGRKRKRVDPEVVDLADDDDDDVEVVESGSKKRVVAEGLALRTGAASSSRRQARGDVIDLADSDSD